jgi:D-alanyl-D-alanine carboxypeptidase
MKFINKKDQFMYLVMASFILVSTSALAITANFSDIYSIVTQKLAKNEKTFPDNPTLTGKDHFPVLSAQAALAIDLNSGVTLYEKNPDEALLPASTTKIVTALVALDAYPLDSVIKVGNIKIVGQKMGLVIGEEMRAEDLIYGLLVFSANDAAEALAQAFPGGREAFINAMNEKAGELSLENTKFYNPSGIDGNGHVTTARDLIRVSSVAMRNPEFAKIVGTQNIIVTDVTGKKIHRLTNINELLGKVAGVLGVKTGWTEFARENLVTYIERDGHKIMIAVLGSQDRFGETKELIDWMFTNYSWNEVQLP